MQQERKHYPDDHWLKSQDPETALAAYREQQSKAYSRVKNAFIEELLGDLAGKRILDYGCGAGMFAVLAARKGAAEVIGVDAEETVLATARHFARVQGVERQCAFIRSDRFPVHAMRNPFDVILMKDVIEHVPDDQALLDDAAEALVPGGRIVLSTQNSMSLNYLLQGTYRRKILGEKNWCGWDETHVRFYTPMSLHEKLRHAGFRIEGWRSVYLVPYKLPSVPPSTRRFLRLDALSWVDKLLGGIFPYNRLGWNVIVRARVSDLVRQRTLLPGLRTGSIAELPLAVCRESVWLPQK